MKLEDLETRMKFYGNREKPRNEKEAKIICTHCGKEHWQRYQRVKQYFLNGKNLFCSLDCASKYRASLLEPTRLGKENAGFSFDKRARKWHAYWVDEDGNHYNTTKAHWLWEMNVGEVPDGYWVTFIDENPENCELYNLKLISRGERMSAALMGHQHSDEAKKNMSKAHTGKVLSKEHRENMSIALQKRWVEGKFDSVHVGENHRRWRGGDTGSYPNAFYRMRKNILRRDGKCKICGNHEKLHVHHIDRNRFNNIETNLIVVCASCHIKIHDTVPTKDPQILVFRSMLDSGLKF